MSRSPRSFVAVLAVLVLALSSGGPAGRVRSQSPATGHAQVVAQGVVPLAGDDLDWRVYDLEADPDAPRGAFTAATGFTLAGDGDLLVTDDATGRRALLSPGEAALSVDGDAVRVDAAADELAAYSRIVLLPDDFTDDGGAEPAFASDGFATGTGDYDLSLVRDVLVDGEETSLRESAAPILLLVTEGEVAIVYGESDGETPMAAGDALAVDGPVTIVQAGDERAVFVAAVIGDRVEDAGSVQPGSDPDEATPASPTSDGGGSDDGDPVDDANGSSDAGDGEDDGGDGAGAGSLSFAVEVCPLGGVAEGCEPRGDAALIELTGLGLLDEPVLSDEAAVTDDGSLAFTGLPYGDYEFQIVDQVAGEAVVGGAVMAADERPGVYTLTVDESDPAPVVTISILPATGEGSIAVGFYRCPASLPAAEAAVWFCGADPAGWDLTLSGSPIGGDLLLADAPASDDGAVFGGLPVDGTYALELTSAPDDIATVAVRPGLVAEGPVRVDLSADAPERTVTYLGIVAGEILTPSGDRDGDGLADNYETDVYGTDPDLANTDDDPSPDGKELSDGTNPLDAESYAFG